MKAFLELYASSVTSVSTSDGTSEAFPVIIDVRDPVGAAAEIHLGADAFRWLLEKLQERPEALPLRVSEPDTPVYQLRLFNPVRCDHCTGRLMGVESHGYNELSHEGTANGRAMLFCYTRGDNFAEVDGSDLVNDVPNIDRAIRVDDVIYTPATSSEIDIPQMTCTKCGHDAEAHPATAYRDGKEAQIDGTLYSCTDCSAASFATEEIL